MNELIEWLRAQLDEDERVAMAVLAGDPVNGQWTFDANGEISDGSGYVVAQCEPENHEAQWHIARHDPARVLRDVAAKRAIIDEHSPIDPCDAHDASLRSIPCGTLLLLASAYADRPGWREEWKP